MVVASHWQNCVQFDCPRFQPQTSRSKDERVTPDQFAEAGKRRPGRHIHFLKFSGLSPVYTLRKIVSVRAHVFFVLNKNSVSLVYRFTAVQAVSWLK